MRMANAGGQNAEPSNGCIGIGGIHLRGPVDSEVESWRRVADAQVVAICRTKAQTAFEDDAAETKERKPYAD